jgi:hypothetical protein
MYIAFCNRSDCWRCAVDSTAIGTGDAMIMRMQQDLLRIKHILNGKIDSLFALL